MELKTPLYDIHLKYGGKIVPFAGYLLPVQYGSGIIAEHNAVRTKAGLFDVSHMGEIFIEGPGALATVQRLFANDFSDLMDTRIRYSPMCNADGGIVDDVIVYRFSESKFLVVVNASNTDKDFAHMTANLLPDTECTNCSDSYAQIAIQGPESKNILSRLITEGESLPAKYYSFADGIHLAGVECMVSNSGYTGETGFEIYVDPSDAVQLWDKLIEAGEINGLIPCGLGARDTLRLEASMPLYGHELADDITPFEAGLGKYVHMEKSEFIGKDALLALGDPTRIRVGLEMIDRGIAREHCDVFSMDKLIGRTTSGTMCPFIGKAVAMAMLEIDKSAIGTQVEVDVRGRKLKAVVVALPFYKRI